jgi:Xaa-Pro aminopeptidase
VTVIEQTDRAERLVSVLPQAGVDLLLVTDLTNLRYLTGFVGTNGIAVIGENMRAFATDFRYAMQMAEQVDSSFDRRQLPRDLISAIADMLPPGEVRLGFETSMPVRIHKRLRDELPDRVDLVPAEGLVEQLRTVKEPREVERIHEACALADHALEQLLAEGLVGRTERDVALALEMAIRKLGAESVGFEPIVAAGPNGAEAHATPREVEIRSGEMVVIDWGARLDGYCSDCTRTIATGEPDERAREVYDLVLRAQLAGLGAVRAGAVGREVDSAARQLIDGGGYAERFGHGLGHGVGLDIHEEPRLTQASDVKLEAGNTVTIEPGVYIPGSFGVRIEDLVVVTSEGCDVLTAIPKELRIVD